MSNEDEEKKLEASNFANDGSKVEFAVLPENVSSVSGTATKRKRSNLIIPTASVSELPMWVAGKPMQ